MPALSTAARDQLATGQAGFACLCELAFARGTERYWSGSHTLHHAGHDWQPTAGLADVSAIESADDFRANGITLSLFGLPAAVLGKAPVLEPADYKGRSARFILAVFDPAFETVLHEHAGRYFIDQADYVFDPDAGLGLALRLETETRYGSRPSIRRYSGADQQAEHPGDLAFDFLAYLSSGVEVRWGTGGSFFK